MNCWALALFGCLLVSSIVASPLKPAEIKVRTLVGARECTWGPSYWCSNLVNAKNCRAVRHCIQTVWEKKTVPVDNDSICQICKDMVTQARDQLESNETQADLQAVFEGSCNLIPIKIVRKECDKLADDFVPELVEALSSQMNPDVVCSVAGLCNNAAIDKMIEEMPAQMIETVKKDEFTCGKCNKIATQITNKFLSTDRDEFLEQVLRACGQLSSFSDACSSIVLTYFNDVYDHMSKNLNSDSICHLSGVCSAKYHVHEEEIEIRPKSEAGVIPIDSGDDIPCKLCEQLVQHLRDLLIANTTESEFKTVLEGVCKQTKTFKDECLSIVDQYYDVIYNALVSNLDSEGACFMIGICPKGDGVVVSTSPMMPLIPVEQIESNKHLTDFPKPPKKLLGVGEPKLTKSEIQEAQLPIDKLMMAPSSMQLIDNGGWCIMCQYFLHFVQESLSEPKNEEQIKKVVSATCHKLPSSVGDECKTFVDIYGDAIIALLIQEIDPTQVCPMMKLCPPNNEDIEVFAPHAVEVTIDAKAGDKPTCPLCLFAVTQLQEMVKSDKSKDNIKNALNKLCSHLSPKLKAECNDFIQTYTNELVEMLVGDFTAQEICVYLKLCTDSKPDMSMIAFEKPIKNMPSGDIETNEISDNTINGVMLPEYQASPDCFICEEAVKMIEKRLSKKKSKESIEQALEHACDHLPKYRAKCEKYVEKYGDQIIDLMLKQLSPKEICAAVGFCIIAKEREEVDELDVDEALIEEYVVEPSIEMSPPVGDNTLCAICEMAMIQLESELKDKNTQAEIEKAVRSICSKMPNKIAKECNQMIDEYGNAIITFLDTIPPKKICAEIQLCMEKISDSDKDIIECAVCQGAVYTLDHVLNNEQVDEDIESLVEKSCTSFPSKFVQKCQEMVKIYGISILKQLKDKVEKEDICVNVGMCHPHEQFKFNEDTQEIEETENLKRERREKPLLIGANECTWGPSHWCSSHEVATKCGVVSLCAEKKLGKWKN